jgi:hypothetical protein
MIAWTHTSKACLATFLTISGNPCKQRLTTILIEQNKKMKSSWQIPVAITNFN